MTAVFTVAACAIAIYLRHFGRVLREDDMRKRVQRSYERAWHTAGRTLPRRIKASNGEWISDSDAGKRYNAIALASDEAQLSAG